jgi:hypothetical protein
VRQTNANSSTASKACADRGGLRSLDGEFFSRFRSAERTLRRSALRAVSLGMAAGP